MSFYICRDRQQLGQYSVEDIRYGLAAGKFFGSDLGWQKGMEEWTALEELIEPSDVPLPVRPPKEAMAAYMVKPTPPKKHVSAEGISGFAVIAMLMGLLALLVYGLFLKTDLAAEFFYQQDDQQSIMTCGYVGAFVYIMIFGHRALAQINRSKGKLRGKSMAMSGIFMGYFLFILLTPTTVALALPAMEKTGSPTANLDAAVITLSESRAKMLVDACIRYAASNGGVFPERLEKLVDEHYLSELPLLKDPLSQDEVQSNYEYLAEGMKESDPGDAIVLRSQPQQGGARVIARKNGSVSLAKPPFR